MMTISDILIFNDNVEATDNIENIVSKKIIFIAIPAQSLRNLIDSHYFKDIQSHIIVASKGIEIESSLFLTEIVTKLSNPLTVSVISGPCFSDEVAQDLPTAVTFASKNKETFEKNIFNI